MIRTGWKVPAWPPAALLLVLPGCGGEPEVRGSGESRSVEVVPSERVHSDGDDLERTPPPSEPLDAEPLVSAPALEVAPPLPEVAVGTSLHLALERSLSTRSHRAGDAFHARVTEEVLAPDGLVLIPEGSRVEGRVVESRRGAAPHEAVLVLEVEALFLEGARHSLAGTAIEAEAPDPEPAEEGAALDLPGERARHLTLEEGSVFTVRLTEPVIREGR